MARDLNADLETLRNVLDLAQRRDFTRAAALAEQTLAGGFEHPMLLNVVATRLEQEGKIDDALRLLERAVAISPGDVGARNALALCLQRLDRPVEALHHLDELLKRHPDLPFAHANKGNALISLGLLGRAAESHRRALELEPGHLAATAALASIATHRGAHTEARRWAEQALKTVPGLPDAVLSLAAAELAGGAIARAETRLQHLILDSRAGPMDRARAMGLLGDVMDSAGRYAEAFAAYQACNEAQREIHRGFEGSSARAYTRAVTTAFDTVTSGQWRRSAEPASARGMENTAAVEHVFLLGFPRSGTTLLEVVLDGHPHVTSIEEVEVLADGVLRFMREPLDLERLARAGAGDLQAARQAYWDGVRRTGVQVAGKVFVDKHPLNTIKLPLIARLFPRAKILFAIRDPRDVVLGCFRRRFKMNPSMYEMLTLTGAADFYDAAMTLAGRVESECGLDWHPVRYESLVATFEPELRAVCAFIGLEWIPGLENFAARAQVRELATPSTAQLSQGLVATSVDHWRHYAAQLQPVMPVLAPWVARFGYPSD